MATRLKLVFDGYGGKKISFNYPYADTSASVAQVKTLMQGIVTNGEIYVEVPQAPSKAEFLVSDVIPIDIS